MRRAGRCRAPVDRSSAAQLPAGLADSSSAAAHSAATVSRYSRSAGGLRDQPDEGPGRGVGQRAGVDAVDLGATRLPRPDPGERPQQARLARSVAAHQRDHLAAGDAQVDPGHRDRPAVGDHDAGGRQTGPDAVRPTAARRPVSAGPSGRVRAVAGSTAVGQHCGRRSGRAGAARPPGRGRAAVPAAAPPTAARSARTAEAVASQGVWPDRRRAARRSSWPSSRRARRSRPGRHRSAAPPGRRTRPPAPSGARR